MIYAINYDLRKPGQNYDDLYVAIKSLGEWWHYLDSTWLVNASLDANGIFNGLKPFLDQNDFVLICGITKNYSGWLPEKAWEWIRERSYQLA